jgi:hypothetical protein
VTDSRPRPQYGEYATPEEQARAMGVPAPADPAADGLSLQKDGAGASSTPGSATSTTKSSSSTHAGAGASAPAASNSTAAPVRGAAKTTRPRRIWDSVLTAILLGIGIVSVTSSIPQYASFPETLNLALSQLGYSDYSNVALATSIGIAINVTQIVLYVAGAAIALLMVRRNRLAFIYPLIAGVLFVIVMIVLLVVVFASDPALIESITSNSGA